MESSSEIVSNTVAEKSICVEDLVENAKLGEVKVIFKEPVEEENTKERNQNISSSAVEKESEEVAEETEEEEEVEDDDDNENDDDDDESEEDTKRKITAATSETPDECQTKTITVSSSNKVEPSSTNTVVINSEENNPAAMNTQITEAVEKPDSIEYKNVNAELVEEEEEKKTEDEGNENVKQEVNGKAASELEKSDESSQQQPNKNQIPQDPETQSPKSPQPQPPKTETEETIVDAPSIVSETNPHGNNIPNKQENFNNTIKDIISSIDNNIKAEENIAALKERELELLKKQQELAIEIEQQRLLAQKLANENQLKQQFYNKNFVNQESTIPPKTYQPAMNVSKYTTFEENQGNNVYSRKSETFETRESTNVTKKIDLNKIFTPATDAEEILPKNRKLYASSAFYSPTLHPTVEDQVELARRISHSLSDISNQQSRGQSMYVNRKKRSVKWVHEGCGQDYHQYKQQPRPSTSPNILPAYTDAAKHRVQLNLHQEQLLEKYARPGLKVVQTPWEAALNAGSASAAFVEEQKLSPYSSAPTLTPSPTPQMFDASQGGLPIQSAPTFPDSYSKTYSADNYTRCPSYAAQQHDLHERQQYTGSNSVRELAYKPSIPQGWKAPSMSLPKDLYMPKEIPLQSYAPPPAVAIPLSVSPFATNAAAHESNQYSSYKPLNSSPMASYSPQTDTTKSYGGNSTFPLKKPYQPGFLSTYGTSHSPKQQYLPPNSYQKVQQNTSQNIPQVNFNPSPLPYDKLAKFENQTADDCQYVYSPTSRASHLNVRGSKVRNTSPAPFGSSHNRPYTPSSDSHYYGGTPSASPRPLSTSTQQYRGHNTPNISHPTVTSNQLLSSPSYNTSARGWGCSGGAATGYQYLQGHVSTNKPQMVNVTSMPYTDF